MKTVTCNKCGWVWFQVSREHAVKQVAEFNIYFESLSKQEQNDYYGGRGAVLERYESCWCGNSYKNFRDSKPGDCPDGCTISPIIDRND